MLNWKGLAWRYIGGTAECIGGTAECIGGTAECIGDTAECIGGTAECVYIYVLQLGICFLAGVRNHQGMPLLA